MEGNSAFEASTGARATRLRRWGNETRAFEMDSVPHFHSVDSFPKQDSLGPSLFFGQRKSSVLPRDGCFEWRVFGNEIP